MIFVNVTDIENNFDEYLEHAEQGDDVVILRNNIEVARLISSTQNRKTLIDDLTGIIPNVDEKAILDEKMSKL